MMVIEVVIEDRTKRRRKCIVGSTDWCCRCNAGGRFDCKNHGRVFKLPSDTEGTKKLQTNAIVISQSRLPSAEYVDFITHGGLRIIGTRNS